MAAKKTRQFKARAAVRTGLFVAGRMLATALLCVVLAWSVSGAFAQGLHDEETPDRRIYARVIDWAQEKSIAIAGWIKDGFSRFALLFGRDRPQLAAANTPAASPQVLGESAFSEDIPLAESPPGEVIPESAPDEPVVEPVAEEPSAPAPIVQEESPEQTAEVAPVAAPDVEEETIEAAPGAQPESIQPAEEKKKSSDVIIVHGIDGTPPQSSATALAATTTSASFDIAWTGQDNLRGDITLRYDVQYQVDSGDWTAWLTETVLLSSLFTGEDENTYGFRTRSRDPEGNWEEYPSEADTSTYLNLSVPSDPAVTSHATSTVETVTGDDDEDAGVADVQVTLSGTGDANDTLVITLAETSTTATTTISSAGAWSQQFTLAEDDNTFSLRASEADGDSSNTVSFSLALELVPTLDVVINEIAWMGTAADFNDEWLELYNASSTAISLAGWTLSAKDGTPDITLSGTIAAKSYFVLERTASTTISDVSEDLIYTGALGNTGELLSLRNASSTLIDRVGSSTADWFAGDNDTTPKKTMERINPTSSGTESSNWATNDGTLVNGLDADGNSLTATPGGLNSVNTTIPRTITNLTFQYIYTSDSSVRLYWTAPKTANLATTTAATYDVRYRSAGPITSASWGAATQAAGEPTPSSTQGTVQTFDVTGLTASTTYYFAVKTNNGVEDSGISNSPDTHTWQANGASYTSLATTYSNTTTIASSTGPYLVTNNITINAGVTVTVEPGTVIKMNTDGTSTGCDLSALACKITVNGTLVLGSASDSINGVVITSRDDNTYGGTVATSDNTPAAGDWGRIVATAATSNLDFNNAIIRYGGLTANMIQVSGGAHATTTTSIIGHSNSHGIIVGGSTSNLVVSNSIIHDNNDVGIGVTSSAPANIQGSTFTGNTRGISVDTPADEANITITGNNFYSNNGTSGSVKAGLQYADTGTLTATNNWWGSSSGPTTIDNDGDSTRDAAYTATGTITYTQYSSTQFDVLPSNL
ncbi:MAG: lamin tail domain-containing protein [Parcubacteria group bacterium]|nr:lamin tail domain-containing protein [Parcubacteria group bacterium]